MTCSRTLSGNDSFCSVAKILMIHQKPSRLFLIPAMTTETKPTVTLFLTLEEAEALQSLFHRRPDLWRRHAEFADVGYPERLPKVLRAAIKEAK